MDMYNIFMNGDLTDEMYIRLPEGFAIQRENVVCRLVKSLYGLKRAPKQWNSKLLDVILKFWFVQSKYDLSLCVKRTYKGIVQIHVYGDNILIAGDILKLIEKIKAILQ